METILSHHHPFLPPETEVIPERNKTSSVETSSGGGPLLNSIMNLSSEEASAAEAVKAATNSLKKLQHNPDYAPWQRLPFTHWPMLFGLYNMSLYGQYITLLPPIQLSMTISPESAVSLRHPR